MVEDSLRASLTTLSIGKMSSIKLHVSLFYFQKIFMKGNGKNQIHLSNVLHFFFLLEMIDWNGLSVIEKDLLQDFNC